MEKSRNNQHLTYLDFLNIGACFCVIWMHCNGLVHTFSNTRAWKESLVVETIAYWAVPVFYMISGVTLMGYREKYTTNIYFKKRILKTVIPFLAWSVLNMFYKGWRGELDLSQLNLKVFIDMLINTKFEGVYWFFIPLFAVYLSIPVLSLLRKNRKILLYMVSMSIMTISILPTACVLMGITYNGLFQFPLVGGYVIFVILGYLLSTADFKRRELCVIYILGIIGILVRFVSTYIGSIESGELNQTFWGYMNFPSVFLAMAVFVAFRYIPWEKMLDKIKVPLKCVQTISSAGFGIYLIHMMVIRQTLEWFNLDKTHLYWRTGGAVFVYIVSLLIVLALKRIPYIKYIVP